MKNIIISIFVLIGLTAIITGFTPTNETKATTITVNNESATDYKVCISCYNQEVGSATIGWGSSASFNVKCEPAQLSVTYGTYGCTYTAYSSGYNEYTIK